jgi:hypothetical protein
MARIIKEPRWLNQEKSQILAKFVYDDGRTMTAVISDTADGNPDWKEIMQTIGVEQLDENTKKALESHVARKATQAEIDTQRKEIDKQNALFNAKQEAFDIQLITDSSEIELRSSLRKAKNIIEVNAFASAIIAIETMKKASQETATETSE